MMQFNIPQMSCGHCAHAVKEAVHDVDPAAKVDVDLATKRVEVDTQADRAKIVAALAEAGYEPK
jgi:copper chaperone